MPEERKSENTNGPLVSIVSAEQKNKLRESGVEEDIIQYLPWIPRFSWDRFIWEYRRFIYRGEIHEEDSMRLAREEIQKEMVEQDCIIDNGNKEFLAKHKFKISEEKYHSMVNELFRKHQEGKLNLILQRYTVGGVVIHLNQYARSHADVTLFNISTTNKDEGVMIV